MKIKKTFQGELPENRVVNTYSDSLTDAYSANYLNDKLRNVEVSSTEPTNGKDIWVQIGKNLFNKNSCLISGKYLASDGSLGDDATLFYQETYIPVEPNTSYVISNANNENHRICEYDANKTFLTRFLNDNSSLSCIFTSGPSTKFIRVSCRIDNIDSLQIEKGEIKTDYEPYIPKKIYVKDTQGNYNKVYDESGMQKEVYVGLTEPKSGEKVWIRKSRNLFDGSVSNSSTNRLNYSKFYVSGGRTYTINAQGTNVLVYIEFFDNNANKVQTTEWSNLPFVFTTNENIKYIDIYFRFESNGNISPTDVTNIQLEQGSTATYYEPYVNKKIYTKNDNDVYEEFYNEESLDWKEAIVDYDNSTVTVPINWNELKEISFRVLGTESATFGYVTIPKGQWHDNGTYGVLVNCINGAGGLVGYRRFWVSQKNTNNFIIKFDGNATNVSVYYK